MASPDFWQGGFEVLQGFLDDLETLSPDGDGGQGSAVRD
jgi:hypothetical protein